jgi:hypothetical protein
MGMGDFYAPGMFFLAVVSDESDRVIEFFPDLKATASGGLTLAVGRGHVAEPQGRGDSITMFD